MANLITFWTDTTLNSSALDADAALVQSPLFDKDEVDNSNITPATAMDANGGPLKDSAIGSVVFPGPHATLTDTGFIAAGVIVGMYCDIYVSDDTVSPGVGLGAYRIDSFTDTVLTLTATSAGGSGSGNIDGTATVSYRIGGSLAAMDDTAGLQAAFDRVGVQAGAGPSAGVTDNNLDIMINQNAALDINAIIDVDATSGSTVTRVKKISCDSGFIRSDGAVIIKTSSAITALLEFAATSKYTHWYGFEFDGGDGSTDATYCIYNNVDGSDYHVFENCEFHNATSHNVNIRGVPRNGWFFMNCNNHDSGGSGYAHSLSGRGGINLVGGDVHDCTLNGWSLNEEDCSANGTKFYDNTQSGIEFLASGFNDKISNCTFFSNTKSGIKLLSLTSRFGHYIFNNSFVDNTEYGIEFQTDTPNICNYLDYNHFDGNVLGEDDLTGTRNSQNDISGDPLFVSETPGQAGFLKPSSSSPLIDAGVGGTGDTIGALCAEAGGAGGGLNRLQGLLG